VAAALGYSNSRKALLDHVDQEDRTDGVTIRDAIGRDQKMVVINECGLYGFILSTNPSAAMWTRKTRG
jgi:prophage antirepressor-like protein